MPRKLKLLFDLITAGGGEIFKYIFLNFVLCKIMKKQIILRGGLVHKYVTRVMNFTSYKILYGATTRTFAANTKDGKP